MRLTAGLIAFGAILNACAPAASTGSGARTGGAAGAPAQAAPRLWPVITRIHVDLWLHGYAMLMRDTSTVPVFRRGYRDRVQQAKNQRTITTRLDANRTRLQERLALSPALANGQFAPMYFASWSDMQQVISLFIRANGDARGTQDRTVAQYFAVLNSQFPTNADRQWLALFVESLEDEHRLFYQEYWTQQNGARMALIRRVDSLWQGNYRQRLQRFLNNTQQENGDFILALTLGGEGRTVNFSARQNAVGSTMPEQNAEEAFYVFAHEVVSGIVTTSVNDNTTPTQQREGLAGGYITLGTVRAGAMLLERAAPELLAGYTRYYLTQAGQPTTGDINARLASTFPLPDAIKQAIERQLDVVLGGI
jgi:hypothetical protein